MWHQPVQSAEEAFVFPNSLEIFGAGRFTRSPRGFRHLFSHQLLNESRASKSSMDSFQNSSPSFFIKLFGGHKGGQFQLPGPWGALMGGQAEGERHKLELGLSLSPLLWWGAPHPPKDPPAPLGIRNTHPGSNFLVGKTHPNTALQKSLPENLSPESHFYPLEMHPTSHGIYLCHPSNLTPLFYILFWVSIGTYRGKWCSATSCVQFSEFVC